VEPRSVSVELIIETDGTGWVKAVTRVAFTEKKERIEVPYSCFSDLWRSRKLEDVFGTSFELLQLGLERLFLQTISDGYGVFRGSLGLRGQDIVLFKISFQPAPVISLIDPR